MKSFKSLRELAAFTLTHGGNDWIYVNIQEWASNPKATPAWIIEESLINEMSDEEVYESEAGPFLPNSLKSKNLWPWMTQDILLGVLQNLRVLDPSKINVENLIKAINHYREFDAFMD